MHDLLTGRVRVRRDRRQPRHERVRLRRAAHPRLALRRAEGRSTATRGLGWTYRDEAAMAAFDRPLEDPLVEKLLVAAILRINPEVKTEAQAKLAVAALRKAMSHPDKLTANRQTLDLLRDGAKVVLKPGEDARTVTSSRSIRPPAPQRLHRDQPVPRAGREAVPRGHGAAGQRHPARDRRVQELRRERQGLARGGAPAPPLPAPGAADADAERLLRRGRRGRVPLRHRALPRREQGRHRAAPRLVGPLAEPLPGATRLLERAGGGRPGRSAGGAGARACCASSLRICSTSSSTSSSSRPRRARRPRRSRATSSSRR